MKLPKHTLFLLLTKKQTHYRRLLTSHCSRRYVETLSTSSSSSNYRRDELECISLHPPIGRELQDFYRDNFSLQRNKRIVPSLPQDDGTDDVMYVLKKKEQQETIASLRLTRSKYDRGYTFLRSLCTARTCRLQGLGVELLLSSLKDFDNTSFYYCFASSELVGFYEKAGFERILPGNRTSIPKWMAHSYKQMAMKWRQRDKSLELFIWKPIKSSPVQILLLQHCEEVTKSTATGWLADDKPYNQSIGSIQHSIPLQNRIDVRRLVWAGRNDTAAIEKNINELMRHSSVYLLWTGQNSNESKSDIDLKAVYIILDGTWQQAQNMYRKIPMLWNLPRLSLAGHRSKYTLRKDYTGWRGKFSASDGSGDLLCTAEVMAALLDRRGDDVGACEIRTRLDEFQKKYPIITARRKKNESLDFLHELST
eukprot:scaffold7035_cov68-Cyclotella_meneghiniana.AAC.2